MRQKVSACLANDDCKSLTACQNKLLLNSKESEYRLIIAKKICFYFTFAATAPKSIIKYLTGLKAMTNKRNTSETNYSQYPPSVETKVKTVNFLNSDALVGQILDGRFLIVKDLTEWGADAGGIGLVYLAKDLKMLEREVVVKILKQSSLQNEDFSRKFQHEKEALIRLDHPNIVRILDSGTLSDGNPFMVMEYINGCSLNRVLLEQGRLPLDFIAHIIESVTNALTAAHLQKILHRDIKPANIMLTPQEEGFDRVRLIDFGIARVSDSRLADATATSRSIGTLLYIAPEQLWGKLEQTPAIDIYAFAIVIYKMLTGELPFKAESEIQMFELQKQGVSVLPTILRSDFPMEAEKILLSALEFDAEKRPQNARAFGQDFVKALNHNINYKTGENVWVSKLAKTATINLKEKEISSPSSNAPTVSIQKINPSIINPSKRAGQNTNKKLALSVFGALAIGALIFLGFKFWTNENKDSDSNKTDSKVVEKTNSNSTREIESSLEVAYFLNVQKMRNGKPFETPFKSSGQEIFENGYKFKMAVQNSAEGFLYLFNEDKDTQGNLVYNILYPTPKTNNGSAQVSEKEQIETSNNTFSGSRGTEIVWLIWSAEKQEDLEKARQSAFDTQGTLKDSAAVQKLKNFLDKHKVDKTEVNKDMENQQTIVKGEGETVVHRIELEHR